MKAVVVIGEILVEIMADAVGDGFHEPMALSGPYPSGAPAIFIDQVAKLGQPCAIVSAVGDDDFGRLNLDRLRRDGVDVSSVRIDTNRPTGSAFVRYRKDGSRNFIFNIRHSACGFLQHSDTMEATLSSADHFHVMGSSLSSREFVELNVKSALSVKARGGTVSFDPNLRKEILDTPGMREAMMQILAATDLFLPSGEELTLLTEATDDRDAVRELLSMGMEAIVHKQGAGGVQYHDASRNIVGPAFQVEEIDPTGAGDCFGGAFIALWLRGMETDAALKMACAAGALAVTRRGPMEGTSTLAELDEFMNTTKRLS
ncbi:tagatose kinase [Aurantimonas marina]|uniref:tagatose kinase n=1 Tax=Aurantimonas marina TaxID=2780508 RepID=UPI0019D31FB0|nr:sugar kinase [Aurantimonas marina]